MKLSIVYMGTTNELVEMAGEQAKIDLLGTLDTALGASKHYMEQDRALGQSEPKCGRGWKL